MANHSNTTRCNFAKGEALYKEYAASSSMPKWSELSARDQETWSLPDFNPPDRDYAAEYDAEFAAQRRAFDWQ